MQEISVAARPVTVSDRRIRTKPESSLRLVEEKQKDSNYSGFVPEVDENFRNYLTWNGLANEDNLLVLSSKQHYYYDYEELKDVTTLINLKKLNLVRHLDDFLHTLYNGLSPRTNFIGCFSDRKSEKGINSLRRFYKKFINLVDSRIDTDIDRRQFTKLLESHGFKLIDMTEINGLTYFRTQNFRVSVTE